MGNVIKNRPDENTVGGRLLKMMELNKDSMASLARKTGMVHVTVFDLVHNNRNSTDYNNLRKIAEHYNISLDWLIGRALTLDCDKVWDSLDYNLKILEKFSNTESKESYHE